MAKRKSAFDINPHKANMKITINSAMIGVLFFMLTFILASGQTKFNFLVLAQLVLAIPLLYVSTLTYSKIAYWQEFEAWDFFGWMISNLGNTIVLNAIGLMVASISRGLALTYFLLIILLMSIYSIINISYMAETSHIKSSRFFKLVFFLVVLLVGGLVPFLLMA
ncbi:MAG: hypothetical protein WCW02_04585 [Candidatus Buchananbacteria bacterium]